MTIQSKTLVAYFSCGGVTKKLAETLAGVVKGDLFEIRPAVPYSDADLDWRNSGSRSSVEMRDPAFRPAMAETIDLGGYGTVFVGFPIWWYVAPTIVNTFLESGDFSGKTVIPFATSGSSGVGETDRGLHASCSEATRWRPAKRFAVPTDASVLESWVNGLNLNR